MNLLTTAAGTLPVGIEHGGKKHLEFELRRAKVADTLDAFDEVGGDSALMLHCAQLRRQIVKLGDIAKNDITTAFVSQLDELDFDTLTQAQALLAKKPPGWPGSSIPSWPASPPLPAASAAPSSA